MNICSLPRSTRSRLPRYYRYARELLGSDVLRISSSELASMMGVTASQIRQDMSLIGQFGQQGYGYNVRDIYDGVGAILGMNSIRSAVIVGMDPLGEALAKHNAFTSRGIRLDGLFDYSDAVGRTVSSHEVMPLSRLTDFCLEKKIDIAVLCVPRDNAIEACTLAVDGGVRAIWNITGAELRPQKKSKKVTILDLNIADCLLSLCCSLNFNVEE
ncbi:MAG: redox-sensing transcriptional repressor Rex [Clostridia bacterium]|jgi:redox-sensing transcriptional repressor|nr:redox-sensing transcriptional repressor Rex [Clostridia bacterium]